MADSSLGVPSYPLYKRLSSSLLESIDSKTFCRSHCNFMLIPEGSSFKQKEAEWQKLVFHKGSELVNVSFDWWCYLMPIFLMYEMLRLTSYKHNLCWILIAYEDCSPWTSCSGAFLFTAKRYRSVSTVNFVFLVWTWLNNIYVAIGELTISMLITNHFRSISILSGNFDIGCRWPENNWRKVCCWWLQ